MEDLLSILTNPIVLFFLISALLNFFKKGKEEEPGKKPANAPQQEKEHREIDWREIFRQEAETAPAPKREQPAVFIEPVPNASQRSNELLEKYEASKRKKEAMGNQEVIRNSPIYGDDLTKHSNVHLDFSKLTREDAIKGVIWSEVLGKPRAKKSYRPTMMTRRKQG